MTLLGKNLLGILGDLLDVSLALEENIVPEYLIEQNLRELFIYFLKKPVAKDNLNKQFTMIDLYKNN